MNRPNESNTKKYNLDLAIGANTYSETWKIDFISDKEITVLVPESIPVGILFKKENDAALIPKVEVVRAPVNGENKFYNSFTFDFSENKSEERKTVVGSTEQPYATEPEAFKAFYNQLFSLNFQDQGQKKAALKYLRDFGIYNGIESNHLPEYHVPAFLARKPNIGFAIFLGILIAASIIMLGIIAPPLAAGAIITTAAIIELTVGSVVIAFALPAFIRALVNIFRDGTVPPLSSPIITSKSNAVSIATPAHVQPTTKQNQYTGLGPNSLPTGKSQDTKTGSEDFKPKKKDNPLPSPKGTATIGKKSDLKNKLKTKKSPEDLKDKPTDEKEKPNPVLDTAVKTEKTAKPEAKNSCEPIIEVITEVVPPAGQEDQEGDPSLGHTDSVLRNPDPEDKLPMDVNDESVSSEDEGEEYNAALDGFNNKNKSTEGFKLYSSLNGKNIFNKTKGSGLEWNDTTPKKDT